MRRIILVFLFGMISALPAFAQSNVLLNYRNSTTTTVQVSPTNPLPVTTSTTPAVAISQAQTGAAASSLVAKATAGSLVSISGSAVAGSYVMLFNLTAAPSNGAVTPAKCWGPMAASGPFTFGWNAGEALTMSTGITVVSSSTGCFTQTLTNANFIAVEYQ